MANWMNRLSYSWKFAILIETIIGPLIIAVKMRFHNYIYIYSPCTDDFYISILSYPASYIQHPTSYILHPTSSILHPASYIQHPTSSIHMIQHKKSIQSNPILSNPILSYPSHTSSSVRLHIYVPSHIWLKYR